MVRGFFQSRTVRHPTSLAWIVVMHPHFNLAPRMIPAAGENASYNNLGPGRIRDVGIGSSFERQMLCIQQLGGDPMRLSHPSAWSGVRANTGRA